jgi:hypothetical protein
MIKIIKIQWRRAMQVYPLRLFRYTYWADDLVLEGTRQLSPDRLTAPIRPGFLSTLGVLVHIMAAERVWLSRWKGDSPDRLLTVDDIPTLEALERAWTPQRAEMLLCTWRCRGSMWAVWTSPVIFARVDRQPLARIAWADCAIYNPVAFTGIVIC